MYKEALSYFSETHWIILGFLLFVGTFVGALIWTLFIQKKEFYDQLSEIPLKEGKNHGRK